MAIMENITLNPGPELISNVLDKIIDLPGVSTLIKIFQAIGIVLLVYFIFLIIRTISQISHNLNIKKIAKNVEEINQKMNSLIDKKIKKLKK